MATADDRPAPRITSVMGVARALLSTVSVEEAVEILVAEFGWDQSFQALALLRGEDAETAFGVVWEHLLTGPVAEDLRRRWTPEPRDIFEDLDALETIDESDPRPN